MQYLISALIAVTLSVGGWFGLQQIPNGNLSGLSVLKPSQGGTGIGSATAGDVGDCIKVLDDSPFTYELGTCGGASSSAFEVATTTDIALSEVAYITKTSGRTTIGSVATGTISVPTGLTVTANRYALGGSTAIGLDTGYVIPLSSQIHSAVTLSGALDYITLVGQDIVRGAIDLATDITGTLPIANGGTGATTFTNNRLLTGNGTSAIVDEANLTFDGSLLTVTGNASTTQLGSTDSAYFATSGGNVGIGTTTPWAKFAVNPVAGDTNQFVVGSSTATSFIINNAGNVGVGGTTNPVTPFYLSDTSNIDTNLFTSDKFIFAYNSTAGFTGVVAASPALSRAVFKGVRSRGTLDSPTVPSAEDSVFTLLGAIWDGDQTHATAGVDFIVDGAVSDNVAPQRIGFLTGTAASRTERVTIKGNGNVGIATTTPWRKFSVTGTVGFSSTLSAESGNDNYLCIDPTTYEITNGGINCGASSERYKENIKALGYGLEKILQLEPVSYTYKETGTEAIGLIAEDVFGIIPDVVELKNGEPESIDYDKLVAPIINAIKELNAKDKAIEKRLDALERELATLKRMCLL